MFVFTKVIERRKMADVEVQQAVRETTPSSQAPIIEKRIIRMRSPSPSFRGRSMTPIRGRSVTPLQRFREKSATPSAWRSITPFISREDKEKTPFEIGPNIIQQLASYKAIIDKALVMDISLEEEAPAKYIISEQSVIDKAAVMDLSNVEIIYVEDDDYDESDYRESESPASTIGTDDREKTAELTAGSDDEQPEKKKKTKKGAKKVVKKKSEKKEKEKEDTPPRLKLDMDPPKPKVSKAKMFEQTQKAAEEKPLDKPPPKKKGGKLTGALAAMKAEEAKMKEAEDQKKQIEEKMKKMKAEQEAKKEQAAQDKADAAAAEDEENEERGSEDEGGSEKGSDDEGHSGTRVVFFCSCFLFRFVNSFKLLQKTNPALVLVLVLDPRAAPDRAKKKKTKSSAKRRHRATKSVKIVHLKTISRDQIPKMKRYGPN